jgi:hypothetical protein
MPRPPPRCDTGSFHDAKGLKTVVDATGGESLVFEGADHLLEVPDDVEASLGILEMLTRAMLRFAQDR